MKTKYLKNSQREKGQTTIETALMMIFLLVLFFGISEIARAWWLKNQLNNAARVAVRVAIVTNPLVDIPATHCVSPAPSDPIVIAACDSITNTGLHNDPSTTVALTITDDNSNGKADSSEAVKVTVQGTFRSVVPNLAGLSFGLFRSTYSMPTSASMRYE